MIVYSIARAVNEGWIDKSYLSIAINGRKGLTTKIEADGQVNDICIGTGIEDNIQFYYNSPTELNDLHGLGAVILAGTEMIKAERQWNLLHIVGGKRSPQAGNRISTGILKESKIKN